jgi:hypothetical protein
VAAWAVEADERWAGLAERALDWFWGANDPGIALADPERGACRTASGR